MVGSVVGTSSQSEVGRAVTSISEPAVMGGDTVRLSIVIPNYNHGSMIGEAIAAFATQSVPPDEIIVVDDGSTDDSLAILAELSQRYPALRVLPMETNQGTVAAMNHGLRAARGSYVNFGAADDVTHPGLFAAAMNWLQRYPSAAYACTEGLVVEQADGRTIGQRPPILPCFVEKYFSPAEVAELLRGMDNLVLTGTAVIRRRLLLEAGAFDPRLRSFADGLVLRQLALRYGFCFIPRIGLTWQMSSSGFSRSEASRIEQSLGVMQMAVSRMDASGDFPPWYPRVFERRWRFGIGRVAIAAEPMDTSALLRLSRNRFFAGTFRLADRLGARAGRYLSLACLTFQGRPMSLIGIIRTAFFRRRRAWRAERSRPSAGHGDRGA
jgi:glycosyltransferase involved in cell wall biosynthesis